MRIPHLLMTDYRLQGVVLQPPSLPEPPEAPEWHGTNIGDYVELDGDQVVYMRPGLYVARRVSAGAHPAGGGVYGGNLILAEQIPGTVFVDQSPPGTLLPGGLVAGGDLILDGTTEGVIFCGPTFVKGTIQPYKRINFWATDHSYPATTWAAEPGHLSHRTFHGDVGTQYHVGCRTFDVGAGQSGLGLYGANIHHTGTGVIVRPDYQGLKMVGTHAWSMTDGGSPESGASPGLDPNDIVHPSVLSCVSGVNDVTVADSFWEPGLDIAQYAAAGFNFSDGTHAVTNLVMARTWITNMIYNILNSDHADQGVHGSMNDIVMWANRTDPSDPAWTFGETVDGHTVGFNTRRDRIDIAGSGIVVGTAPTGVDPATIWRLAHGSSVAALIAYFNLVGWP